jgi:tetratricopeptide (TPR) repeat protein
MSFRFLLLCVSGIFFASAALSAQNSAPSSVAGDLANHRRNAQIALQENHPERAISELRAVLKADPGDLQASANLGVLLYFRSQYAEAIPLLRAALAAKPDLWKIQSLLGLAELNTAEKAQGRNDLATALPHLIEIKLATEVRLALADALASEGDMENALATLKPLLETQTPNAHALYMSYRIYADLADRSLLTLAIVEPEGAAIHQAMGRDLARQNKTETALADYQKAIIADPNFPGLHTEYGKLLYSSPGEENQRRAEEQFNLAIKTNPGDAKAELMLGVLAWKRDDVDSAYAHDLRAMELSPDDSDVCLEFSKVLTAKNDLQRAEQTLLHAIQMDPTNSVAYYRLGQLHKKMGKANEAKDEIDQYLKYKKAREQLEGILHSMQRGTEKDAGGPM